MVLLPSVALCPLSIVQSIMADTAYLNFDLQLTPAGDVYQVRVLNSPVGQARGEFRSPFLAEDLTRFAAQLGADPTTTLEPLTMQAVRTVGGRLFAALFTNEIYACLTRSLDEAQRRQAGLRLRLRLHEAPDLWQLPWEYLYFETASRFLALSTSSPLVYYLDLPQPVRPLTVQPPVVILGVIAAPLDRPSFDGEQAWQRLEQSLSDLIEQKLVQLVRLENPTLPALQQALRQHEAHILHFVGHADSTSAYSTGLTLLNADRLGAPIAAQQLGQLLHNEATLRLVLIHPIGAPAGRRPIGEIAHQLVQQGIPAVIGLQFAIPPQAIHIFSGEFYAALADGYGVDAALTEARVALATQQDDHTWGAAQLFLRTDDARLWSWLPEQMSTTSPVTLVSQSLSALSSLMNNPIVRSLVATFRSNFQVASQQIELLAHYKELHDLLHKLQFRCYHVIRQELERFPQDPQAVDNLLNYEVTLQEIAVALRTVAGRNTLPASEVGWIEEVVQAQMQLNRALTGLDGEALKHTVWLLKRTIALHPSTINQRLSAAARMLRLGELINVMTAIQGALVDSPAQADHFGTFQRGGEALRAVDQRLTQLISDHDQWQAVERILGRIEDVMIHDRAELEFSWPDVRAKVDQLCQADNTEWVQFLQADGAQLDKALAAQNPLLIERYFRRYRQRAGSRFYQVDVMLKAQCEELRQVGEPLTAVLKLLE